MQVLSCGHRCTLACHAGPCAPITDCKKKVKVTCLCKRIKEEFRCFNVNSREVPVACDAECAAARVAAEEERKRTAKDRTEEESELSRREAELFEKRQEGVKRRRRNRRTECAEEEEGGVSAVFTKYRVPLLSLGVLAVAVIISLHFFFNP